MPVYGDLDPDRRYRQLHNLSQAGSQVLGLVTAARERERLAEEDKRRRDVERFYQLARTDPEAARAYGAQLVGQLEGNERAAMEAALSAAATPDDRARPFLDAVTRAEQDRQMAMAAGQAPQSAPGPPGAMMGMGADVFAQNAAQRDPRVDAYRALPFEQRVGAREYFQERQMGDLLPPEPRTFDPMRDLPANVRAVYAAETMPGALPEDARRAARIGAQLEEGAAAKRGYDIQEEAQRFRGEDLELREKIYELSARKETRLAQAQAAGGTTGKDTFWKDLEQDAEIAADVAARTYAGEATQRAAAEAAEYGEKASEVKPAKFQMTKAQRSKLVRTLKQGVDEGLMSREQAVEVLHGQVEHYQKLLADGRTPYDAWREVMGEKK